MLAAAKYSYCLCSGMCQTTDRSRDISTVFIKSESAGSAFAHGVSVAAAVQCNWGPPPMDPCGNDLLNLALMAVGYKAIVQNAKLLAFG